MEKMKLTEVKEGHGEKYIVTFSNGSDEVHFEMWIDGDEIPYVTYETAFDEFVHYNTSSLGPIFEVVLRFHKAREIRFPPDPTT